MGCTADLLKTGIYAALGIYGTYKFFTWHNPFWELMAGAVGVVGGIQAARNGWNSKKECNFKTNLKKRK